MDPEKLNGALLSVVKLPYPEFTKRLIKDGANVNCISATNKTPIWYAIKNNQTSQVEVLIANGADLEIEYDDTTPFMWCIWNSSLEIIALFKNYHISQEKLNVALMETIRCNKINIGKLLIEKGADINYVDKNGCVPILYAVRNNKLDYINFLIESSADLRKIGTKLLCIAMQKGYIDIVKLLLEKEGDYNKNDSFRQDILRHAITLNMKVMIKLLMDKWPLINIFDNDNNGIYTFYMLFYYMNDTELVKIFIDKGINVNQKNDTINGFTPLMAACAGNKIQLVKLLLDQPKIDITITDNKGLTALEHTTNPEIINLLKDHAIKSLPRIEAICDKIPSDILTITIPVNLYIPVMLWKSQQEKWINTILMHFEKYNVEITPNEKMRYHNHPISGYIQFDSLTMPDGTIKNHKDLYH
jgi:ankyrin repeat protein